jgi:hypothetical protein
MVNAAAAEIYARSGKPDGKAADHWAQARRKCAVPDGLHV